MPAFCPHCGAKQPAVRVAFCPACRNDVDEPRLNPQTGKPMRETVDLRIWYGMETRIFGWLRHPKVTAHGALVGVAEGFQYVRSNGSGFEMRRILAVHRVFPWLTTVRLALCYAFLLLSVVLAAVFGFSDLTGLIVTVAFPLLLVTIRFLTDVDMCWVRVAYRDEQSQALRAYFTIGSFSQRLTGGGRRLYALFSQLAEQGDIVIPPVHQAEKNTATNQPRDTRFFEP